MWRPNLQGERVALDLVVANGNRQPYGVKSPIDVNIRLFRSLSPSQLGVPSTQSSTILSTQNRCCQKHGIWREPGLPCRSRTLPVRSITDLGSSYVNAKTQPCTPPCTRLRAVSFLALPRSCPFPFASFFWSSRGCGGPIAVAYSELSHLSTDDRLILLRRYPSIAWAIITDSVLRRSYTYTCSSIVLLRSYCVFRTPVIVLYDR